MRIFERLKCWWMGHLDVHEHDGRSRWVFCLRCGRRSPGWQNAPATAYMDGIAAGVRQQLSEKQRLDPTVGRDQANRERRVRLFGLQRTLRQREALDRMKGR